jgi:ectoine hydroxylase-related dioxygenase (phytanoyl-CoA dioxygenase family)
MSLEIHQVLKHVIGQHSTVFLHLAGNDGVLVELSVLLTLPGAAEQKIHSDIAHGELLDDPITSAPGLASVFVALQDVTLDMGPTHVIPYTHTKEYHINIFNAKEAIETKEECGIDSTPPLAYSPSGDVMFTAAQVLDGALLCSQGDSYVMDSRCAHLGGANKSNSSRAMLCFAFQRKQDNQKVPGFTYHIEDELVDQYTVQDFIV